MGLSTRLAWSVQQEAWPLREPFHINGYAFTHADVIVVTVDDGEFVGRGEGAGVYYRGETPATMAADVARAFDLRPDLDRQTLQSILPPGGARAALDAALWDIEAHRAGQPVWQLAGVGEPRPARTTITLGVAGIASTVAAAIAQTDAVALKLKLAGDGQDEQRIREVRAIRPDVWLAVDANQALDRTSLLDLAQTLVDCAVSLVEQPLAVGREADLRDLRFPVPLAADESFQDIADLSRMAESFQVVNIKLDKCGGLTEALRIADEAEHLGLGVMAGTMITTSLGLAPAFVLAQRCAIADLDGPTFLAADRTPAAIYRDGHVVIPADLWGGA